MRTKLCAICVFISIFLLLCTGCISQRPVQALLPTPSPSPSPTPMPLVQSITPVPRKTDHNGKVIYTEDHFMQYLTFSNIRIYEYGGGTYLDGICTSAYTGTLFGQMGVTFYDEDENEVAGAELHTAQSFGLVIYPGENHIYAEIGTDMDVQMMDYAFRMITQFMPE